MGRCFVNTTTAHRTPAGSTTSRPRKPSHADTAIALRGFSTTTAAHALRFYTEARNILNIIIVISTINRYF